MNENEIANDERNDDGNCEPDVAVNRGITKSKRDGGKGVGVSLPVYRRGENSFDGEMEQSRRGCTGGGEKIQFQGLPAAQLMIHRNRDKTRDKHRERAEIDRS